MDVEERIGRAGSVEDGRAGSVGALLPRKIEAIESFLKFTRGEEFPRFPIEVFFEVSNVCDLACVMCPTFSAINPDRKTAIRMHDPGFLNVDEVLRTAGPLLERALVIHAFGYGEPTLHPEFGELLARLSKYEAMIDFFTNGMHLTESLVAKLVDLAIHHVTVSFSGATAEEYESVYQGGKFRTVLEGLTRLRDRKRSTGARFPKIHVHSLSFEHHLRRLDDFVELMADHGVEVIEATPLIESRELSALAGHASGTRDPEVRAAVQRAERSAAARGIRLIVHADLDSEGAGPADGEDRPSAPQRVPIGQFQRIAADLRERPLLPIVPDPPALDATRLSPEEMRRRLGIGRSGPTRFVCLEPFKTLYLRRGGQVKTCCYMRDDSPGLGDVRRESAEEIWRGVPYELVRASVLAGQYPERACGSCLANRLAPSDHMLEKTLGDFSDWHPLALGHPFDRATRSSLAAVRSGEQIASRHWDRRPEALLPPGGRERLRRLLALLENVELLEAPHTTLIEGWVDHCSERGVAGWVWSPLYPDLRLSVSISRNGERIAELVAREFRPDLVRLGKGDGRFGFAFLFEGAFPPQADAAIRVDLQGTRCEIPQVGSRPTCA